MIRKLLAVFLVVCACTNLCSCSDYRELEKGYLVAALCFSSEGQGLTVRAETLFSASDGNSAPKIEILTASGENALGAIDNLELTLTRQLYFDHCAALIVENSISLEQLNDIISYCNKNERLNEGLYVVLAEDIDKVLEIEPVSNAVGFDIMNLMKKLKTKNKIDYKNRFYEMKKRMMEGEALSLPLIKSEEGRVRV